jgi:hypothetical protein
MREAGIGRLLVASLHQGISDLLPARLEFYENWLNPDGLRLGTIGLAPLTAVLSFLRQEGEAYQLVVARAGTYAADWTCAGQRLPGRSAARLLPEALRLRLAMVACRRLVRLSCQDTRAVARLRRGAGTVEIRRSIFCSVREPVTLPLCGFYAAAFTEVLKGYGVDVVARVDQCRAAGSRACVLKVGAP